MNPSPPRHKYGTVRILFILNNLGYLMRLRPFARLRLAGIRLRQITVGVADKVSVIGTEPEGSYVIERTFQASWIQDTGLIAATLLD
jgi:hypothetical protein